MDMVAGGLNDTIMSSSQNDKNFILVYILFSLEFGNAGNMLLDWNMWVYGYSNRVMDNV